MDLSFAAAKAIGIKATKNLKIRERIIQEGYPGSLLKDRSFEGCMFDRCSSKNLKFQRLSFIGCDFKNCIFDTCRMEDCVFERCNFWGTIFSDTYLDRCKISDTALLDCQVLGSVLQEPHICVNGTRHEQRAYSVAIQRLFDCREDVKNNE